jgi:hypothetical protein
MFVLTSFVSLPFLLGAGNPYYDENWAYTFLEPSQSHEAFSYKTIDVAGGQLTEFLSQGNDFVYAPSISNWKGNVDTNAIGGAMNILRFGDFRTTNVSTNALSYYTVAPDTIGNNYVFMMGNNLYEDTRRSASFTSNEIVLPANGYYIVSVDFYAVKAFGAFDLVPGNESSLDDGFGGEMTPRINLSQASFSGGGANGIPYYDPDYDYDVVLAATNESV